jgi:hypothetical protein
MIKIDDEFYIDSDSYQYVLLQKKFSEKRNEYTFEPIKYTTSIERCVEIVMQIKQRRLCKEDMSLAEALNKFKEINNEMKIILSQIKEIETI